MIQGYIMGAIALLGVAGSITGYIVGRSDGASINEAGHAKAAAAVEKDRKEREADVAKGEEAGQVQEVQRDAATREVYREIQRIIPGDPVYVDRCLTADGVRALDRAAANANGEDPGQPVSGATQGAGTGPTE